MSKEIGKRRCYYKDSSSSGKIPSEVSIGEAQWMFYHYIMPKIRQGKMYARKPSNEHFLDLSNDQWDFNKKRFGKRIIRPEKIALIDIRLLPNGSYDVEYNGEVYLFEDYKGWKVE